MPTFRALATKIDRARCLRTGDRHAGDTKGAGRKAAETRLEGNRRPPDQILTRAEQRSAFRRKFIRGCRPRRERTGIARYGWLWRRRGRAGRGVGCSNRRHRPPGKSWAFDVYADPV
jgi:hypothetical protein